MKTTVEISDNLLAQTKQLAREQNTTLRSIIEEGLVLSLKKRAQLSTQAIHPVVFGGNGLRPEFRDASWQTIREAAYEQHKP